LRSESERHADERRPYSGKRNERRIGWFDWQARPGIFRRFLYPFREAVARREGRRRIMRKIKRKDERQVA